MVSVVQTAFESAIEMNAERWVERNPFPTLHSVTAKAGESQESHGKRWRRDGGSSMSIYFEVPFSASSSSDAIRLCSEVYFQQNFPSSPASLLLRFFFLLLSSISLRLAIEICLHP